jgi:hypothetical protein
VFYEEDIFMVLLLNLTDTDGNSPQTGHHEKHYTTKCNDRYSKIDIFQLTEKFKLHGLVEPLNINQPISKIVLTMHGSPQDTENLYVQLGPGTQKYISYQQLAKFLFELLKHVILQHRENVLQISLVMCYAAFSPKLKYDLSNYYNYYHDTFAYKFFCSLSSHIGTVRAINIKISAAIGAATFAPTKAGTIAKRVQTQTAIQASIEEEKLRDIIAQLIIKADKADKEKNDAEFERLYSQMKLQQNLASEKTYIAMNEDNSLPKTNIVIYEGNTKTSIIKVSFKYPQQIIYHGSWLSAYSRVWSSLSSTFTSFV